MIKWSFVQCFSFSFFRVDPTEIDYQTPVGKEPAQCNVTLHSGFNYYFLSTQILVIAVSVYNDSKRPSNKLIHLLLNFLCDVSNNVLCNFSFCFLDRLTTFVEKKTPSLGESSSSGPGISKPAIVFRKRKVINQEFARKRDEDNNWECPNVSQKLLQTFDLTWNKYFSSSLSERAVLFCFNKTKINPILIVPLYLFLFNSIDKR